jgi:hypothetical protein
MYLHLASTILLKSYEKYLIFSPQSLFLVSQLEPRNKACFGFCLSKDESPSFTVFGNSDRTIVQSTWQKKLMHYLASCLYSVFYLDLS